MTIRGERDGDARGCCPSSTPARNIERHHLPRIFERFYRVDPAAREHGGTGVGLAIVKHLAQGMAGEVGVESGGGIALLDPPPPRGVMSPYVVTRVRGFVAAPSPRGHRLPLERVANRASSKSTPKAASPHDDKERHNEA